MQATDYLVLAVLTAIVSRILIYCFVLSSHRKIKKFIDDNVSTPSGVGGNEQSEMREEEKSKRQAELVAKRDKNLSWITHIVGSIEMLAFVLLTVFLLNDATSSNLDKIKYWGVFLVGWLGIKILSSHRPWSDYIAGKAYYHISLIGTLLNVITGVAVGWLIQRALFVL